MDVRPPGWRHLAASGRPAGRLGGLAAELLAAGVDRSRLGGERFFWWFRDRPEQMPSCNERERELIRCSSGRTDVPDSVHSPLAAADHRLPPLRNLLVSLTMWSLCALVSLCFGWYFYPTWQPEYLKDVFGISYEGSEYLTGRRFCGALGSLIGGTVGLAHPRTGNRRWGRSRIGIVGFTGAGLCVFATGFATAAWQAVTLLCLAFLVNDLAIPVIWATCADVGGRYAGTVAGVMNMAGGVGAILSPILIPHVLRCCPPTTADPSAGGSSSPAWPSPGSSAPWPGFSSTPASHYSQGSGVRGQGSVKRPLLLLCPRTPRLTPDPY